MRRISDGQRRARLARRHHLGPNDRAAEVVTAVRDLVAVHSTDPASVFLGLAARVEDATVDSIEHELYDARSVVRLLGMRRTVYVVPVDLVPIVNASSTRAIAARERKRWVDLIERGGISTDATHWLEKTENDTLRALRARGEATAAELARDVPALKAQVEFGEGKKWAGVVGASTRVLFLLAADGRIVRGRPRGSWTSSQYRWAPMSSWVPPAAKEPSVPAARAALAERWLRTYGPGTVADLKWWTGWTAADVRRALSELAVEEVELDSGPGLVLADDAAPVRAPTPFAALLPSLDTTVMGWSERGWLLGPHGSRLFDRSGNPGPTVWWDSRVVGGWTQRRSGEVVYRLLEDVGRQAIDAVEAEAARLTAWLGPARVTPRFRTPLERELTD
jgi:DNA glycosylase AlkZ-like